MVKKEKPRAQRGQGFTRESQGKDRQSWRDLLGNCKHLNLKSYSRRLGKQLLRLLTGLLREKLGRAQSPVLVLRAPTTGNLERNQALWLGFRMDRTSQWEKAEVVSLLGEHVRDLPSKTMRAKFSSIISWYKLFWVKLRKLHSS